MSGPHHAVILAAGASRRLGMPKQLLERDGEPLVSRACRMVSHTRPRKMLLVTGAWAPSASLALHGATVVHNAQWSEGLSSSLRTAAAALAGEPLPVLVTLVDQPALDAAHLDALLASYAAHGDTVSAYGAAWGVPAVVSATLFARAQSLQGDRGLRALWPDAAPRCIRDDRLTLDMDTSDDVARAVSRGWLDRPKNG